jgi:hypothetical protein
MPFLDLLVADQLGLALVGFDLMDWMISLEPKLDLREKKDEP